MLIESIFIKGLMAKLFPYFLFSNATVLLVLNSKKTKTFIKNKSLYSMPMKIN